ncbi:response regulator transcription factor [Clostridium estertheticum]|uniref:Stage 0 sporulation protein A homolog n=1 Tax=Clostridium estertheticum TaxID=238834 RepID=A0A5N7ISI7_9CLOT|nr:response regulator transcription factor [Clostridium estertheticum]MBX4264042.1 response regulator transcription factor [Clostridium estertheticum]MPQ33226.1 response regulator transcription factor [Clostridium estertheticum]MPQ63884.1 response regulator transcription factor [Clostridium estertheticum]WLC87147.1 response regulator transcription factor [Clostridium estertheticum]
MNKILIIEDDIKLSSFIKEFIEKYAYNVVLINDFNNIETEFFETKPDLILLDINLPYSDGFQLCRAFRRESDVPIIFISARSSEFEQIRGLEMGADDYIVKPFSFELLLAKIQAAFRRVRGEYNSSNGLLLNKKNFEISVNNNILELSKKEFQLLNKLVLNEDVIVTREELLEELWDETFFVDDHTLTVNVTRLRNKLAMLGLGDVIKTKRGLGYIYQNKVSES